MSNYDSDHNIKEYTVQSTEIHTCHTKVILEEFPNLKFNSAHFRDE